MYTCQRKWSLARGDYEYVLRTDNENITAIIGLEEMNQKYEELPMAINRTDSY